MTKIFVLKDRTIVAYVSSEHRARNGRMIESKQPIHIAAIVDLMSRSPGKGI